MTTHHAPQTKATIPSPLPHHRGVLTLPETLKTSITSALFASNGAIPNIQTAMRESLTQPNPTTTNHANTNTNTNTNTTLGRRQNAAQKQNDDGNADAEHGYMGALGTWLASEFAKPGSEDVTDEAMLRRLMERVRAARGIGSTETETETETEGNGRGCGNGSTDLKVPEQAVSEIVSAVKRELERCCVVVDGEEWVG